MPMGIHKQAIEKKSASRDKPKNKSNKTLFTQRRVLNIYLHKLPFILDFKDKKSWIAFQVQLVNLQLLLFKWCKMPFEQFKGQFYAECRPSRVNECKFPEELFPRELSTAICIVQEFLARIKRWVEFVIL